MSDSTLIYLIRHGETVSNVEGRFRGRANIPLSENGLRQSSDLAEELRDIPLDVIYSSPLTRSLQTADFIARTQGLEVIPNEKFHNIDLGEWTDRPKAEIQKTYPRLWQRWITEPEDMVLPGGESIIDVMHRSYKGLIEVIEAHKGKTVAIVSHRAVLKPLISAIIGICKPFFWKIHLDTAGYSVIKHSEPDGFIMIHLNLVHHILDLKTEKV